MINAFKDHFHTLKVNLNWRKLYTSGREKLVCKDVYSRKNITLVLSSIGLCILSCVQLFVTPWNAAHQPGSFQARILEWVAIFFSSGSSQPRDWTHIFYIGKQFLYHWATIWRRSKKLCITWVQYLGETMGDGTNQVNKGPIWRRK